MNNFSEIEFSALNFMQQIKRKPYCFERCSETFENKVKEEDNICYSISSHNTENCVKKYEAALKILRSRWSQFVVFAYNFFLLFFHKIQGLDYLFKIKINS